MSAAHHAGYQTPKMNRVIYRLSFIAWIAATQPCEVEIFAAITTELFACHHAACRDFLFTANNAAMCSTRGIEVDLIVYRTACGVSAAVFALTVLGRAIPFRLNARGD
ncbi:hypothetical protein OHD25_20680 [Escherichia coli]|nr:hypothetical protein [Escherichia coli]